MPTYLFFDKNTKKEFTKFMSISERDEYLKTNPNIEQLVNGFPGISDPMRCGQKKPDDAFRDKLKEIKKAHKGSTINTW